MIIKEQFKNINISPNQKSILSNLIFELSKLPGLGERSAERLAFHMLKLSEQERKNITDAIITLRNVKLCKRCFNFISASSTTGSNIGNNTEALCEICSDANRDQTVICVVEQPEDLWKIEKTAVFKGVYHVLHGVISPLDGTGPEQIYLRQLIHRIKERKPKEIILSTNPTAEGDNTALYIQKEIKSLPVKITRLGRGIPAGSSIEYLNKAILIDALKERKEQI